MPYFHDSKNLFQCEQINKTKKKKKLKPSLNSNSETSFKLHMSLWILYFGVFRFKGGWWEFHPFLRAALPTLMSLRSPTQTLGYLHGYSGSKTPENIAQKAVQCLLLCGDAKTWFAYQGQNMWPTDFAPTLLRIRARQKREADIDFIAGRLFCFIWSDCRIFIFCPRDICAQWQRLFHVFSWRAFCVSGVWRLIPVIWFTGYRYNTYTWYVK